MDIHIDGADALKRAETACRSIFGPDVSHGPMRPSVKELETVKNDFAQWKGREFVHVMLNLPPTLSREQLGGLGAVEIPMHRVQIICGGRLIGHALRMDDLALQSLAAWEAAWQAHRQMVAH